MPRSPFNDIFDDDDGKYEIAPAPALAHFQNSFLLPGSREIHITEAIEEVTGTWFTRCVRWLETHGPGNPATDPIRVFLCTPGGDEEAMFTIVDTMRTTACPVEVIAIGQVCSAGVVMLACGDQRLVTENVALMSHESHGSEEGLGFRASQDRMKYRKWQHNRWCELMARYTLPADEEKDAGWWKRKTERQAEYWLLGGKAIVEAGLADAVIHDWPVGVPSGFTKRDYEGTRG